MLLLLSKYSGKFFEKSSIENSLNPFKKVANYRLEREEVEGVIEQLELERFRDREAGTLSYGDVALLEIGMAIITRPRMILFDEPVCGMSPQETERVVAKIASLAQQTHVVIIEHDMDVVFKLAEEITVLAFGGKLASGTPREIAEDQSVKEVYFGVDEVRADE